jgi:hypothetical protein
MHATIKKTVTIMPVPEKSGPVQNLRTQARIASWDGGRDVRFQQLVRI